MDCLAAPPALGHDLERPLVISPCALHLEPPRLDLAARARAVGTIHARGPADPTSLVLAGDVAFSELAAIAWEGLDEARLRATIALIGPIVDDPAHAASQRRDVGLMALVCAHSLLGEAGPARTRGLDLLSNYSGQWVPSVYLAITELPGEQAGAIEMYGRLTSHDSVAAYASYRLAWALRHPASVDQARAIRLLAVLLDGSPTWPRLDRVLRRRAALELRALGREVEVPELRCRSGRSADGP